MTERVFLVGVRRSPQTRGEMIVSLEELARLVDTAGGVVVGRVTQELHRVSSGTLLHRGKVEEIRALVMAEAVDVVAVDAELTPAQNRNLADAWGCKVLDRTAVILDIFARRAHTNAGKLQVELAQLSYRLPRLINRGLGLMQQSGHIGNRGPGETKLEIDRRRIRDRIAHLKRELKTLGAHRARHRQQRHEVPLPIVALIGYTNAGKSTLLNRLTTASTLVEDRLFATLDPTVRRLRLPSGREILLVDTVGFIRHLPHQLVEAFHATFEEVSAATLLCHLVDASSEEASAQHAVVEDVLKELKVDALPRLTVMNKWDVVADGTPLPAEAIAISAQSGHGLPHLLAALEHALSADSATLTLRLPFTEAQLVSELYRIGRVIQLEHTSDGIVIQVALPRSIALRYQRWEVR